MTTFAITVEHHPHPADIRALRRNLATYNVAQEHDLQHLPSGEMGIVLQDEDRHVVGGIIAELDWGWLYVDMLWLESDLRDRGIGKRMLNQIEQAALAYGINQVYLTTTTFQALDFYQHLGYQIFGELADRPSQYGYYYLQKPITPAPIEDKFTIETPPSPEAIRAVHQGLQVYCEQFVDCSTYRLGIFIRPPGAKSGDGNILGGLYGGMYWDWFDLKFLWLDANLRGQGYGKRILQAAEDECNRRGIHHIVTDTTDFQALPFYQQQGFVVFARLNNRPPGHTSYFIRKTLAPDHA